MPNQTVTEQPSELASPPAMRTGVLVVNAGPRDHPAEPLTRQLIRGLEYAGLNPQFVPARGTATEIAALAATGSFAAIILVGFSLLSGSHLTTVPRVLARLGEEGSVPVMVYANFAPEEADELRSQGVLCVAAPGLGLNTLTEQLEELLSCANT